MRRLSLVVALLFTLAPLSTAALAQAPKAKAKKRPPNPAYAAVVDDPRLPRVLLLGDSISIGYTVPVRELLAGKANVHRPADNCGPTSRGVESIERWLGDGKWDLIHFNFGLHDIAHLDEKGGRVDPPAGQHQVLIAQYEKNLRQLVARLKKTGAKLIWCSTTPVPEGSAYRVKGDEIPFNEVAAKIMREEGIEIDDLYAYALPRLAEIQLPANVHYTPEGSKVLAQQVASSIEHGLKK